MGRKLISFDWALKRILRNKANFNILEGLLSELLSADIKIIEILESEGNMEDRGDKYNRVDLKVRNSLNEIIFIELQYEREIDYLLRILYGASKTITEHIRESDPFAAVIKVITISIVYFDLGIGTDYVYRGKTEFKGLNDKDVLQLSDDEKEFYDKKEISGIYPEHYILKVRRFEDETKNRIDEWIYFLKNEEIKDDFKAKGLQEAKAQLDILKLSDEERHEYERYAYDLKYQASMYLSSFGQGEKKGIERGIERGIEKGIKRGIEKGIKEGREQGKNEKAIDMARALKKQGVNLNVIARCSGISKQEIEEL